MIEIHKIEQKPIPIFYKDTKIGDCETLLSFDDLRLQVAKEYKEENSFENSDYSFEFNGERYYINKKGGIGDIPMFWDWFDGMILSEIIKIEYENTRK